MRSARKALVLILTCVLAPACGKSAPDKPPPTIPLPPSGLTAVQQSTARIDLAWTDGSGNESGFKILRSTALGGPYAPIAVAPANAVAYIDRGLLPGTTYYYQICATNVAGDSPLAGPASDQTAALAWTGGGSMTNGPSAGLGDHTAIFDSAGQKMIVFGGIDDFLNVYSDTYSYALGAASPGPWTTPTVTGTPPLRFAHSAIYDSLHQRMIVFGGQDDGFIYQQTVHVLNLATMAWSTPTVTGVAPSPRGYHTSVYDGANQRMIVFGGTDGTYQLQDAFALSLPGSGPLAWSPILAAGPLKRSEHVAVVDPLGSRMVIFGGKDDDANTDGSSFNNDSWSLTINGFALWDQLTFPGTPSLRAGHRGVYDAANRRLVIHGGGVGLFSAFDDVWAMRLDIPPTWSILSPAAAPTARKRHSAIYDPVYKRMVIYGGVNANDAAFNEVWVLGL